MTQKVMIAGFFICSETEADMSNSKSGARHSGSDAKMIQTMHDHAVALGASCPEGEPTKNIDTETMVEFGGAIKALGDGKIGGYLVHFTDADNPDLQDDFFTKDTNFAVDTGDRVAIYYNHGIDPVMKKRQLGRGTVTLDDVGVWMEAQLAMRDDYERAVYSLVKQGKLGWSSGSIPHLVEREQAKSAYYIKHWPIGEASITPMPAAGPIVTALQPLKTWAECTQSLKTLLDTSLEPAAEVGRAEAEYKAELLSTPEATPKATRKIAAVAERDALLLELDLLALEMTP